MDTCDGLVGTCEDGGKDDGHEGGVLVEPRLGGHVFEVREGAVNTSITKGIVAI